MQQINIYEEAEDFIKKGSMVVMSFIVMENFLDMGFIFILAM